MATSPGVDVLSSCRPVVVVLNCFCLFVGVTSVTVVVVVDVVVLVVVI